MAVTLTPAEVLAYTGATVTQADITIAAEAISNHTDVTVDNHVTARGITSESVKAAWSLVAVRVHRRLEQEAAFAVTSETQGDYTYSEDSDLARYSRHAGLVDGTPEQLLSVLQGEWGHV